MCVPCGTNEMPKDDQTGCDCASDVWNPLNCTLCLDLRFDPASDCTTCLFSPLLDPVANCTECLDDRLDINTMCTICLNSGAYSPEDCDLCANRLLDPGTNCTPSTDRTFDPANGCKVVEPSLGWCAAWQPSFMLAVLLVTLQG